MHLSAREEKGPEAKPLRNNYVRNWRHVVSWTVGIKILACYVKLPGASIVFFKGLIIHNIKNLQLNINEINWPAFFITASHFKLGRASTIMVSFRPCLREMVRLAMTNTPAYYTEVLTGQ